MHGQESSSVWQRYNNRPPPPHDPDRHQQQQHQHKNTKNTSSSASPFALEMPKFPWLQEILQQQTPSLFNHSLNSTTSNKKPFQSQKESVVLIKTNAAKDWRIRPGTVAYEEDEEGEHYAPGIGAFEMEEYEPPVQKKKQRKSDFKSFSESARDIANKVVRATALASSTAQNTSTTNTTITMDETNVWEKALTPAYFSRQFEKLLETTTALAAQSSTDQPVASHYHKPSKQQPIQLLSSSILAHKNPNDVVTVAELQSVLREYLDSVAAAARTSSSAVVNKSTKRYPSTSATAAASSSSSSSPSKDVGTSSSSGGGGGVAFPQPSVLSYASVQWGSTVSAGIMGIVLASSIMPNLWLIGGLMGILFGYDTGKAYASEPHIPPQNIGQSLVIASGRKLAKMYLKVYDAFQTFFFMYKTGQLSYEYYQRYAELDKRFEIQSKIDAWNARFVEGKIAFDRWEKEHEVGRKVLAALRTAWLVEERSLKKRTGLLKRNEFRNSQYRLVQFVYDVTFTVGRILGKLRTKIFGEPDGASSPIVEFFRGLFRGGNVSNEDGNRFSNFSSRIKGIVVAVVSVNLIGALFTMSPSFLALMAVGVGLVWPSWISELAERSRVFLEETRIRGSGSEQQQQQQPRRSIFSKEISKKAVNKNMYHYYRTADGKKRYYRVGKPWSFTPRPFYREEPKSSNFFWPWARQKP
jgi:hypothetical protein